MTPWQRLLAARPPLWQQALWIAAACASSMCGIGGGLFAVPILHFLTGLPLKVAVNTSLVLVFVMTLAATWVEALHPTSALDLPLVLVLIAGGFAGARVGHEAAKRIDSRLLAKIFAVVLTLAGLRILLAGAEPADEVLAVEHDWEVWHYLLAVGIGFAGGFLAPLLGIGGGLFVVPALYLGLPGTTYLAARACSMAMSVVNAGQLTVMNLREGTVHRKAAVWFGIGALAGGSLGVVLVHRPGWSEAARILLGLMLLFVAGRFGWDLRRGRPEARG